MASLVARLLYAKGDRLTTGDPQFDLTTLYVRPDDRRSQRRADLFEFVRVPLRGLEELLVATREPPTKIPRASSNGREQVIA